ncbi:hypothetical protein Q3O60_03800 [Alkalimonas collagenimarina]|uniref:Lipoprotein n=1 Tax=Alkalimonas collagenimarina TaxID=400390 RepID=A0ABT9GW81_9GAMM|nr:hypothetical protein [Alkalimonas collagenimarina]MDP4535310.1 hypothetical protein [Alkalimonas collagenimarina]
MKIALKYLMVLLAFMVLTACEKMQSLTESEQVERTIRQEVRRDLRALNTLTDAADATEYDGFAWRRGERLQIRQRQDGELVLLEQAEAPEIIATAVAQKIPSFSLVRYQQGWLVVFTTYVNPQCQVVYAYAYRGVLADTPLCSSEVFTEQANGQCQSPIQDQWQVFKEWFFAESMLEEGNPACVQSAAEFAGIKNSNSAK